MWQNFAKGLVNIQIGCQKGPLESGECDENSGNLLAMVKTESGKKKFARGFAKIKMTFKRGCFGENGKFGEQLPKSKQ